MTDWGHTDLAHDGQLPGSGQLTVVLTPGLLDLHEDALRPGPVQSAHVRNGTALLETLQSAFI